MAKEKKHENMGWGGGSQRERKDKERSPEIAERSAVNAQGSPGCLRLFVLPHMIAGLFIFYLCVMMVAPEVMGTSCQGTAHKEPEMQLQDPNADSGSKHKKHRHRRHSSSTSAGDSDDGPKLKVTFEANGKTYTIQPRVDYHYHGSVADGDQVPVKYWSLAPEQSAFVDYPGNKHFQWFLIIFNLFWNGIMLLMFIALYVSPIMVSLGLWQPSPVRMSSRD